MYTKDIQFSEDVYIVHPIVRVDRAMTRYRETVQETENEDVYQVREQYANRGETKKATALYYRLRSELFRYCIKSEIGLICKESDLKNIEDIEEKYIKQVEANNFEHVKVGINICLVRVSNANSKVFKQISEDLRDQVAGLQETLAATQAQKASVEENLKTVTHTVDEIKEAVDTIDVYKLARNSKFLETILQFDIDDETKTSIKGLNTASTDLIKEIKDMRNENHRFDFLIVDEETEDASGSEA